MPELSRASLASALAIIIAGYIFLIRPLDIVAGEQYANIDAARATLERNTAMAQRVPQLERERNALNAQLTRVHARERRAAAVDRFLHSVAVVSARDGVSIESIAAGAQPPAAVTQHPADRALVDEVPLNLTLRGRYGDVIRAVRDINDRDAVARVTLASLGTADRRPGAVPQLSAAFHVLLLREADEQTTHLSRPR